MVVVAVPLVKELLVVRRWVPTWVGAVFVPVQVPEHVSVAFAVSVAVSVVQGMGQVLTLVFLWKAWVWGPAVPSWCRRLPRYLHHQCPHSL